VLKGKHIPKVTDIDIFEILKEGDSLFDTFVCMDVMVEKVPCRIVYNQDHSQDLWDEE